MTWIKLGGGGLLVFAMSGACGTTTDPGPNCVCEPSQDCSAPIELRVSDAVRTRRVGDLTANGNAAACAEVTVDFTRCVLDGPPYTTPGVHPIALSAPGFAPKIVDIEVKPQPDYHGCCDCAYTPAPITVVLLGHSE